MRAPTSDTCNFLKPARLGYGLAWTPPAGQLMLVLQEVPPKVLPLARLLPPPPLPRLRMPENR